MPRVLIVDDHPGFRAVAKALLEADGYAVIGIARDGAEGAAAARALRPEIVLLDICLPDCDGFEVAAELRRDQPETAVILTSSRDCVDYGGLVESCGAVGYVPKAELSGEALARLAPAPAVAA